MVAAEQLAGTEAIEIRSVALEAPWTWLARGWRDLWQAPGTSLAYGLIFAAVSAAITAGLWLAGEIQLLPPLAAGFMLVGPLLAVGLYETSRRLEAGERPSLGAALAVVGRAPAQLAFLGVLLMVVLLFWIRLAFLLFALFMGTGEAPPPDTLVQQLLFTPQGLGLLVVGSLLGGFLAFAVFALSAVSVPLLLERRVDAVTAIGASLAAVRRNWKAMLLWAWLIAVITVCGLATLYLGLIVTFPLIGHATWHAYRALVAPAR